MDKTKLYNLLKSFNLSNDQKNAIYSIILTSVDEAIKNNIVGFIKYGELICESKYTSSNNFIITKAYYNGKEISVESNPAGNYKCTFKIHTSDINFDDIIKISVNVGSTNFKSIILLGYVNTALDGAISTNSRIKVTNSINNLTLTIDIS